MNLITFEPSNGVMVPLFRAVPIIAVGEAYIDPNTINEDLQEALGFLRCNWSPDHVTDIYVDMPIDTIPENLFDPIDKGSIGLFGFDEQGNIIYGIARYDGFEKDPNPLAKSQHYYLRQTNRTGWIDG